ncbi:NfeD family protein [Salinivibrio sp. IB643]|uniref:NfeD family protein n=1 Tax=Salinivibrio sp. IB643 TaxID=1909445 RepID=UPI000988C9E2|nr:NfeD family protein [Salinivibrio sp. IB643]OOE99405.1 activity regulator of membrane protease YbbK [Salinivibrio sp. IB643]
MSYYLAELTIIIGLLLLAAEVWLLGLSTIVLLATGCAAVLVGLLAMIGVLPETVTALFSGTGIGAGLLTLALWRPLKRLQHKERSPDNRHSDFIGLTFVLTAPLSREQLSSAKYSGVTWQLQLSANAGDIILQPGEQVKVIGVDVGRFTVEPVLSLPEGEAEN